MTNADEINANFVNAVRSNNSKIGQYLVNLGTVTHGGNHLITCCLVLRVILQKNLKFLSNSLRVD